MPLSTQALAIPKDIWSLSDYGDLVLPSIRSTRRPLSDNAMNVALRRMGYAKDEMTTHGFRATASTILNERGFNPDVIGVTDFYRALRLAARERPDLRVIHANELIAAFPQPPAKARNAFSMKAKVSQQGLMRERAVVPDLAFGLAPPNGSRRYFMVEIDRGTMPVIRSNPSLTSFEQKMRAYLAAYAAKQHRRSFGWSSFRVLTVTTDRYRLDSMTDALPGLHIPHSPGPSLFLFATRAELAAADPLTHAWIDGGGRTVALI